MLNINAHDWLAAVTKLGTTSDLDLIQDVDGPWNTITGHQAVENVDEVIDLFIKTEENEDKID